MYVNDVSHHADHIQNDKYSMTEDASCLLFFFVPHRKVCFGILSCAAK